MHQSFREGFEKDAKARWYKEYLKSPKSFVEHITGGTVGASLTGDAAMEPIRMAALGTPLHATHRGGWTGGMRLKGEFGGNGPDNPIVHGGSSDVAKALGLQETVHPHIDLPLTNPRRRSLYEKRHDSTWIRKEPQLPKGEDAASEYPYRVLGSKKKLDLVHVTKDADALTKAPHIFTPAAVPRGLPTNRIFTARNENLLDINIDGKTLRYKDIPESDVLYTRGTMYQGDEILLPQKHIKNFKG